MKTTIKKISNDETLNVALDTINIGKQALIFVNTKRSAEKVAEDIARILKNQNKNNELAKQVLHALNKPTKQCERLSNVVKDGIAFHHAGLTNKQKELIEDNFRNGAIKIICCTPTLSMGIDVPAYRSIIRDLKRFTTRGYTWIPVLEYQQMAGRCISKDTTLFTEKGEPVKISDIASKYFKDREIGKKTVRNLKILSIDLKTFKPIPLNVKTIWKRKVKKLLEIETRSGKVIKVSDDHPFLTFTKIDCGKARISRIFDDRMELYEKVIKLRKKYRWGRNRIARYLNVFGKKEMIKHWLSGKIKPKQSVFSWKNAGKLRKSKGYEKTDYLASAINFNKFDEIIPVRIFLPKNSVIQIEKNTFMTKQGHGKCNFPANWSKDLCRFIAKIMSDGSIYYDKKDNSYNLRYYNKNRSVQHEYAKICLKLFNKKVSFKWRRGSYEANFKSYLVGEFLKNIGIPSGKKSFVLRLPEPIFTLPKEFIKNFFLEYVRCDGWETKNAYSIITSSKELAYDFALLLSKIGYIGRVYKKNPNSWRKNYIWVTSVTKSQFNDKKKLSHVGDICPDLVKSIKKIPKEDYVYDLTLDKNHNFIANGLIIHNSGRPKYDTEGQAIIITSTESEKEAATERYVDGSPEDITSKLAVEPALRTYILSLVASGFVDSKDRLIDFFSKTFWAYQFEDMKKLNKIIDRMIRMLEEFGFIEGKESDFVSADKINEKLTATEIGKRIAQLYIDPLTANDFINAIKRCGKEKPQLFALLQMISYAAEIRPRLRIKSRESEHYSEVLAEKEGELLIPEPSMFEAEYDDYFDSIKTAMFFNEWIDEKDDDYLLEKYDVRPGESRVKLEIANWLLYSIEELAKLNEYALFAREVSKLRFRVRYGVKEELLTLLRLREIGRVRARKLFNNGIKDIGDVKKADFLKLKQLLGEKTAKVVKEQVGQ